MKNFILNIWQFPQFLLGAALVKIMKAEERIAKDPANGESFAYYHFKRDTKFAKYISGVSLGKYILLADDNNTIVTIRHEYGHSIQSRYLGVFYLLTVGVYSAIFCNWLDRAFHKKWNRYDRIYWYYKTRWAEKWADKLGNVDRDSELRGKTARPQNSKYPMV